MKKLISLILILVILSFSTFSTYAFVNGTQPPPFRVDQLDVYVNSWSYSNYITLQVGGNWVFIASKIPIHFYNSSGVVWLYSDDVDTIKLTYTDGSWRYALMGFTDWCTTLTQTQIYNLPIYASDTVYGTNANGQPSSLNTSNPLIFSSAPPSTIENDNIFEAIVNLPNNISVFLGNIFNNSLGFIAEIRNKVVDVISGGITSIKDNILSGYNTLIELRNNVINVLSGYISSIKDNVLNVYNKVNEIRESVVNSLSGGIVSIKDNVLATFNKVGDFFNYLNPNSSINVYKDLFVPDVEFIKSKNAEYKASIQLHLPFITDFMNIFNHLVSKINTLSQSVPSITMPPIRDPVYNTLLYSGSTYTFTILEQQPYKTLYDYYLIFSDVMLYMSVILLGWKTADEILGDKE